MSSGTNNMEPGHPFLTGSHPWVALESPETPPPLRRGRSWPRRCPWVLVLPATMASKSGFKPPFQTGRISDVAIATIHNFTLSLCC